MDACVLHPLNMAATSASATAMNAEPTDFNTWIKEEECRGNLISRHTRIASKRGGESKAMQ